MPQKSHKNVDITQEPFPKCCTHYFAGEILGTTINCTTRYILVRNHCSSTNAEYRFLLKCPELKTGTYSYDTVQHHANTTRR